MEETFVLKGYKGEKIIRSTFEGPLILDGKLRLSGPIPFKEAPKFIRDMFELNKELQMIAFIHDEVSYIYHNPFYKKKG